MYKTPFANPITYLASWLYGHVNYCCCSGGETPKLKDLQKFLTPYCSLWRDIGLQLGLKPVVLDQVAADHPKTRDCFRVTLEKWLQLNFAITWGDLELAITNANRQSLGYDPLTSSKNGV